MTETINLDPGSHKERSNRPRTKPSTLSAENTRLIERITNTLQAIEEAADPRRSSPIEGQMRTRRPSSEGDEGLPTRWARNLERRFHRVVIPVLNEFDARVEGNYQPPPKPEKVRCRNRKCAALDKRIPRFVGPRGEIELVVCPVCDHKLGEIT